MAEENDKTGRDEALNEDASTPETADDATDETPVAEAPAKAGKFDRLTQEEGGVRKLTGMYKNWFLDYASYVILERAVPHVEDGLKPVQRRILHAMKVVDDGRYNKVANLVGQTMQYHPHGAASIKDAPPRAVISRRVFRNSPSTWSSTRRRRSGCCRTTAARRNPLRCPSSSRCCWPKGPTASPWDWLRKSCPTTSWS